MASLPKLQMTSRLAIGQLAHLGDLYDARNEKLLNEPRSIFQENLRPSTDDVFAESINKMSFKHTSVETVQEVFDFMNVTSNQEASILSDLQVPSGANRVLTQKRQFNIHQQLLKLSLRQTKRQLTLTKDTIESLDINRIVNSGATHFVSSIVLGADAIVLYNLRTSIYEKKDGMVHSLLNILDEFVDAMKRDDSFNFLEYEMKHLDGISAVAFCDVIVPGYHSNVMEDLKASLVYLQRMVDYVGEDEANTVPVLFVLTSIDQVVNNSNPIEPFVSIKRDKFSAYVDYVDTVRKFEDFYDLILRHGLLVLNGSVVKQVKDFYKDFMEDRVRQKNQFLKWMIKHRKGSKSNPFQLIPSKYSLTKVNALLNRFVAETEELKFHDEISHQNIILLKNESKFIDAISASEQVHVLRFDSESKRSQSTEFKDTCKSFFRLINEETKRLESESKLLTDSVSSAVSNELPISFVMFEYSECSVNNFNSLFYNDENGTLDLNEQSTFFIEQYQNGVLVSGQPSGNNYNGHEKDPATFLKDTMDTEDSIWPNYCRWNGIEAARRNEKPSSSSIVKIPCPGTSMNKCKSVEIEIWFCIDCNEVLEYDFNGHFFCSCGLGAVTSYSFKCNSQYHKGGFYSFSESECFQKLSELKPREEMNILVLGETGVGKSTFINAFANYLSFETLSEAESSDIIALIPSSFTVTDKYYEDKRVYFGQNENEGEETGASKTQSCRAYEFPSESRLVRIIDTPGIGDTRGIKQDEKNFENILSFISNYSNLHGILMLLKPNNSRLSVFFRFCIQELLCHLHKSASENIVFVYTCARSSFYRPGDTQPVLKDLLKQIRDREPYVEIPYNHGNIFCLDNEAFRFLLALKNQVVFDEDFRTHFASSWTRSVEECERLFKHVARLRPHSVKETLSVNETRRLIVQLSKPLCDITQNIQLNLAILQEQKEKIKEAGDDIDELRTNLYVPVISLEPKTFDKPRTVCADPRCYKLYTYDGIQTINYEQVCHNPCRLKRVPAEVVNNPLLRDCSAMQGDDYCGVCGCHYETHMHIYYENVQKQKNKVDEAVQNEIKVKETRQAGVQKLINDLELTRHNLQEEQKIIMKSSAKFASFLKENAITPYNDALKDYLEYLISVEEQKVLRDAEKKALVEELTKMKQSYLEEVKILEDSIHQSLHDSNAQPTSSLLDINDCVQQLFHLEINGNAIRQMVHAHESVRAAEHSSFSERVRQPLIRHFGPKRNRGGFFKGAFNVLQKMWM